MSNNLHVSSPYGDWIEAHPELTEAQLAEISRWHTACFGPITGARELFVLQRWLLDRHKPSPDLLFFYGNFGELVLYLEYFIVQLRDIPPLHLTPKEQAAWREVSGAYCFTPDQMGQEFSRVFNTFYGYSRYDAAAVYDLTVQQLHQGIEELADCLSGDLAQRYMPRQFSHEGEMNGENLDPFEEERMFRPLVLRSLLEGMMAALPHIAERMRRPHVIAEYGLPQPELADRFEAVVGEEARQQLDALDVRLRELLEFWHQHRLQGDRYFRNHDDSAALPKFWWYHWEETRPHVQ